MDCPWRHCHIVHTLLQPTCCDTPFHRWLVAWLFLYVLRAWPFSNFGAWDRSSFVGYFIIVVVGLLFIANVTYNVWQCRCWANDWLCWSMLSWERQRICSLWMHEEVGLWNEIKICFVLFLYLVLFREFIIDPSGVILL